jgi:hypothetical protein
MRDRRLGLLPDAESRASGGRGQAHGRTWQGQGTGWCMRRQF